MLYVATIVKTCYTVPMVFTVTSQGKTTEILVKLLLDRGIDTTYTAYTGGKMIDLISPNQLDRLMNDVDFYLSDRVQYNRYDFIV